MTVSELFRDPVGRTPAPFSRSVVIPGMRGRLYANLYAPGGEGAAPAVLLSHGYPGYEQNLDLAQALRRLGFAVLTYHYSGSWGCDGDFSFHHCIEDGETVLRYLLDHADEWRVDRRRVFAVGHSMGGFVTAHLLKNCDALQGGVLITPWDMARTFVLSDRDAEARQNLWDVISCGYETLQGVSQEGFAAELDADADRLRLDNLAPALVRKPLLCIGALRDEDTPIDLHVRPLRDAIQAAGAKCFTYCEIDSDHCFEDRRLALAEAVGGYLANLI